MNHEKMLQIIEGAKTIAAALDISVIEVYESIRDHGNINNEEFLDLRLSGFFGLPKEIE